MKAVGALVLVSLLAFTSPGRIPRSDQEPTVRRRPTVSSVFHKAVGALVFVGLLTLTSTGRVPRGNQQLAVHRHPAVPSAIHEAPIEMPLPIRDFRDSGVEVMLPSACLGGDGSYDVVIHFHGASPVMKTALSRSELNAALLVVNAGTISGDYSERYAAQGTIDWLLGRVERVVSAQCPQAGRRVRRLALSGWSAGFAAVLSLLRQSEVFARTDAVLLADGLHSALYSRSPRTLFPDALRVYKRFADMAVAGKKLFAITHSAIPTEDYASTTECSDYLLAHLGLNRVKEDRPGPRPDMWLVSSAHRGGFFLEGYAGSDEHAHSTHLWAIGQTLFRRLRDYWAGVALLAGAVPSTTAGISPPVAVSVDVQGDVTCTKTGRYVECRAEE